MAKMCFEVEYDGDCGLNAESFLLSTLSMLDLHSQLKELIRPKLIGKSVVLYLS